MGSSSNSATPHANLIFVFIISIPVYLANANYLGRTDWK